MKPISKLTENGMPVNINAPQIQHTDNRVEQNSDNTPKGSQIIR